MTGISMLRAGLTAALLLVSGFSTTAPHAQTKPVQVRLWRMQCGKDHPLTKPMFSDTFRYAPGLMKDFTYSCYLIKDGDNYMVWDTGLPNADAPRVVDQLKRLGLSPHQIKFVGISHYHFDHIGQAADLADSTLLIGKEDFEAVKKGDRLPDGSTDSAIRLAPWITGGKPVKPVSGDLDVFGDGRVIMLRTPGHTPGHHSLLVRLRKTGNVLLTGDLYHFTENRTQRVVPAFNTDRAQTLASMDRFEEIARRLHALVIIQHEPRDVAKLPAFPRAAE